MKQLVIIMVTALLMVGCGQSYEEQQRLSREQRKKLAREDSAALKIAVMPTLDCLPLWIAKESGLFERLGADVRLKRFAAQMDCDTALAGGSVEGAVSDLVRMERMKQQGTDVDYLTATDAYWQLVTNRTARIRELKNLEDKMVAMARYSVTDLMADVARDSAKLKPEQTFKVQVNDVHVRMRMLQNNEMDALIVTEPQATEARMGRHPVLLDSRKLDFKPGVIALSKKGTTGKERQKQVEVLRRGYNMVCDSINRLGIAHYRNYIEKYCGVKGKVADSIPQKLKFSHVKTPRQQDIDRARQWLKQQ